MPFLTILLQTPIDDPNRFNNYLIFGYAAMCAIGVAYILYLANQQRNVRQDMQILRQILDEADADAEAASGASGASGSSGASKADADVDRLNRI